MRSLASIAGLGTLLFVAGAYGQTLSEHAAAAAGATIGTAAGKPVANALSGIMGQVDDTTATAAKTGAKAKAMTTTTIAPEKKGHSRRDEPRRWSWGVQPRVRGRCRAGGQ